MSGLRSRIGRSLSCRELRGFESRLTLPSVRTKIPKNLVVIMKEVGSEVSVTGRVCSRCPAEMSDMLSSQSSRTAVGKARCGHMKCRENSAPKRTPPHEQSGL